MQSADEILATDLVELLERTLGELKHYEFVSGGLVHWVWKVEDQGGRRFYLKLRGERFREMPEVSCSPEEIRFEANALQVCSDLVSPYFPRLIASWPDRGAILMTSVVEPSELMLPRFRARSIRSVDMRSCGDGMRKIHDGLEASEVMIRGFDEDAYYEDNLYYRLGRSGREDVSWLIAELRSLPRQLIYGDFAPKNLGLSEGHLRIFDLDTVHRGNIAFDVGYFVGHLILHGIENSLSTKELVRAFFDGYGAMAERKFGELRRVVDGVALGTITYRTEKSIVPYPSKLQDWQIKLLGKRAKMMLRSGKTDLEKFINDVS